MNIYNLPNLIEKSDSGNISKLLSDAYFPMIYEISDCGLITDGIFNVIKYIFSSKKCFECEECSDYIGVITSEPDTISTEHKNELFDILVENYINYQTEVMRLMVGDYIARYYSYDKVLDALTKLCDQVDINNRDGINIALDIIIRNRNIDSRIRDRAVSIISRIYK